MEEDIYECQVEVKQQNTQVKEYKYTYIGHDLVLT